MKIFKTLGLLAAVAAESYTVRDHNYHAVVIIYQKMTLLFLIPHFHP